MATVHLAPGRQHRIAAGHPWVYKTEVAHLDGNPAPGDFVDVVDARGRYLGNGYINPQSMLMVRIMTREPGEVAGPALIRRRIAAAWAHRQRFLPDTTCCRVVFAEADFLPGVIVDKFADILVLQTLALGVDRQQEEIVAALRDLLQPRGIYERNDAPVRELEGLPLRKGFIGAPFPTRFTVVENGLHLVVDVDQGQKTGHFTDQRENRLALRAYVGGKRVLDAFCHTGGFGLNAVAGGAERVTAVDISAEAVATARENAQRNGFQDRMEFVTANAFDYLRAREKEPGAFDVIILDPPAFAKNRASLEGAARGYKEINLRAIKMLPSGGILVTCSCSYHMAPELFRAVVAEAARDARRRLRLLAERTQGLDHPILVGYDESHYLKCNIYEVL